MNEKTPKLTAIAVAVSVALGGCGGSPRGISDPADIKELAERAITYGENSNTTVEISEEPFVASDPVPATPWKKYGDIQINVQRVNFYDLCHAIAKEYDIGLSLTSDVVVDRGITIQLSYLSPVYAIKRLAEAAGYVAVFNPSTNHVTIAPRAVFSFKLPKSVFARLGAAADIGDDGDDSNINVDTGTEDVIAAGNSPGDKIRALVGDDAKVSIFEEAGLVIVEGNVRELSVVHNFLSHFLALTTAGLNIRAAIIAVDINEEQSSGVDWQALLGGGDLADEGISFSANSDGLSFNISNSRLEVMLDALQKSRSVEILAQPQISTSNLQPAALWSGEQIPYLSAIDQTVDDGVILTGVETDYARDGILLRVTGDILDKQRVQLRVQPQISSVGDIVTFGDANSTQSSAPLVSRSETNSVVTVESGETIVIGGIRSSDEVLRDTKNIEDGWLQLIRNAFNSRNDENSQREFWVLLNVEISEAPIADPLISEIVAP